MPKREKPFHLDMPFDEALRRYAQTEPRELPAKEKNPNQKKKRTLPKRPRRDSSDQSQKPTA
jgi:hypothetical protein